MEKHACKLCSRRFSNGRALGGHMRSHLTTTTTTKQPPPPPFPHHHYHHPSPPSSSSTGLPEEGKAQQKMGIMGSYSLRENPRKSFKVSDPEFSDYGVFFSSSGNSSSMVVQDGESDTEDSTKLMLLQQPNSQHRRRRLALDHEPVVSSSVSDASPDEDVALCLMMLSRDVWPRHHRPQDLDDEEQEEEEEVEEEEEEDEEEEYYYQSEESEGIVAVGSRKAGRSRYQCGTCGKVFRSYQALGGHRASHKRVKHHHHYQLKRKEEQERSSDGYEEEDPRDDPTTKAHHHQCPFCFRIFASGQALGGHKRSHLISSAATPVGAPAAADASVGDASGRYGESFIDLNLPPAPMEEASALSDTGGS